MRRFLFCVCAILFLTSITMMIFQRDIEQALANKAEASLKAEIPVTVQENLNEQEKSEDAATPAQDGHPESDIDGKSDYSELCNPPHTKDGVGGAGGFIVDDPQCLELLARAIYAEAGGDDCSDETRIMVGNVIINRMNCEWYPDTMEAVLTQKRQYNTFYWTGVIWKERASNPEEKEAVERAYKCAERVLLGERLLPEDVVFQSEYIQGTEIVAYQDGIYFCR